MRIHEKQGASERVVLEGNLAEFREALEEEIETIKKNGQSSILLSNGRCVDSRGEEVWYRFSVEYAPTLPPDTPCKLIIGKDQRGHRGNFAGSGQHLQTKQQHPAILGMLLFP